MAEFEPFYNVTIPSTGQTFRVSKDVYEQNSEKMFGKYPDAQVQRVSLSGADDSEIHGRDRFQIQTSDAGLKEMDASQYAKIKDKMFADYPNTQVYKVSDMSWQHYQPLAEQQWKALQEFRQGNTAFLDEYRQKVSSMSRVQGDIRGNKQFQEDSDWIFANKDAYNSLSEQGEELARTYYTNPNVIRERKEWADMAKSLSQQYREKESGSSLFSGERRDWARAAKLMEDVQKIAEAPGSYDEAADKENSILKAFKDYAKGAGNKFTDTDIYAFGIAEILRNGSLLGVHTRLLDAEEKKGSPLTEQEIGGLFTDAEKALIGASETLARVQGRRAGELTGAYTAGQGFAESIPFMAEFLASGSLGSLAGKGLAKAAGKMASEGTKKALVSWLGRSLMSERAIMGAEKAGLKLAQLSDVVGTTGKAATAVNAADEAVIRPLVQGLWHTATTPRAWGDITERMLMADDPRSIAEWGIAIWKGTLDQMIENWSESVGGALQKGMSLPFKGLGWAGQKTLGKTSLGRFARWMYESAPTQLFKEAGYNGLISEMAEEWAGNAARVMTGLMTKEEFSDFASLKQQLEMAASFAPLSIFGLGSSAVAAKHKAQQWNALSEKVKKILERSGVSSDDINKIFETKFDTAEDIAEKFAPYVLEAQRNSENSKQAEADYKTMLDFARATGERMIYDDWKNIEQKAARNEAGLEIADKIGRDFAVTDKDGKKTVIRFTHTDGKTGFVVGKDEETGMYAVVYDDKSTGFVGADVIAKDDNGNPMMSTMSEDEYLDKYIQDKKKAAEAEQMDRQRQESAAKLAQELAQGRTINLGTVENPIGASVKEVQADGVVVQSSEDGSLQKLSFDDVSKKLGIPIPKTDGEIEGEQVATLARMENKKNEVNAKLGGGLQIRIVDGYDAVMVMPAEEGADGTMQYRVHVKQSQEDGGGILSQKVVEPDEDGWGVLFLTEDELDRVISQFPAKEKAGEYAKIPVGTRLNVNINSGEAFEQVPMDFQGVEVEDGVIFFRMRDAEGNEVAVTEDMIDGLPGVMESLNSEPVKADGNLENKENASMDDVNPLADYMRTNSVTGEQEVDSNRLWDEKPKEWCTWNDTQNTDPDRVSSKEKLSYAGKELDKQIKKLTGSIREGNLKGADAAKMDKMRADRSRLQSRRDELQGILDEYETREQETAKEKLLKEKQEQEEKERKAAELREQKRREKEQALAAAQQAVMPGIQEKWNSSPKEMGYADEIRLANGETIEGTYVLTEADAPTASHNPNDGFKKSEGFPVDENGKTVNDRDYEHDKAAQKSVTDKAQAYDQRALQNPVIVSADGVVLSGNDRTMASQLAASNGTDAAYVEYLTKYAQKYGFSAEQVGQFAHPRVVFVPNAALPYNAATFAKFNAVEQKAQSKTEKAVKFGKTISEEALEKISALIDRYEDYNEFYNDAEGVSEILDILEQNGVITAAQRAALVDEAGKFSGEGRDLVDSVLLGSALNEEAVREVMKDSMMRSSIVSAIGQILKGNTIGGYSLRQELSDAVLLIAEGKREKTIKHGESVQGHVRQTRMFADDVMAEATVQLLGDAINDKRTTFLKKLLSLYSSEAKLASEGERDVFTGETKSKESIIREILDGLGYNIETYDTAGQQQSAGAAGSENATGEQTDSTVQGDAEGEGRGTESGSREGGNSSDVSSSQEKESETNGQPSEESGQLTDAQRKVLGWLDGKTPEQIEAEAAQEREQKRQKPLLERLDKWRKAIGDVFVVHTDISSVTNEEALREIRKADEEIAKGADPAKIGVYGWFEPSTGKAHIYLPHVTSEAVVDNKILHEVIAHKGLRGLFKTKEEFNRVMDKVWDEMSEEAREYFTNYVNETGTFASEKDVQRAAADEYVAHVSEGDTSLAKVVDDSFWNRLVEFIKDIFKDAFGGNIFEGEDYTDIGRMLKDSLAEFVKDKRKSDEQKKKDEASQAVQEDVLGALFGGDSKSASTKNVRENPQVPISQSKEKYEDFGEKIGMARKDTAVSGFKRDDSDGKPSWMKKYTTINVRPLTDEEIASRDRLYGGFVKKNFEEYIGDITKGTDSSKPFVAYWTEEKKTWNGKRTIKHYITDENRNPIIFTSQEQYEATLPVYEAARAGFAVHAYKDGKFRIDKRASNGKYVEYAEFNTREEALAYLASPEGATDLLNRKRDNYELPALTELTRNGMPDYRKGKDITPDDFQSTFGFRGGEFGNWVNAEERQQFLNYAYDALMDLATILHISPQALSLGGELSIAFGARGHQGARAHYEATRAVINLTKMNGAGSLAHEWAHALDNYFGMMDAQQERVRDEKQGDKNDHFMSEELSWKKGAREEVRQAVKNVMKALTSKMEERAIVEEKEQEALDKRRSWLQKEIGYVRTRLEGGRTSYQYNRKTKKYEDVKHTMSPEQLAEFDSLVAQLETDPTFKYEWDYTRAQWRGTGEVADKLRAIVKDIMPDRKADNPMHDLFHQIDLTRKQAERLQAAKEGKTETLEVPTTMLEHSEWFDRGRASKYFSKPLEMFARAFETYIAGEMKAGVQSSDYLTYEKSPLYMAMYGKSPYPMGAERMAAKEAFDKLFQTIQEKTDETTGKQVLYSRVGALPMNPRSLMPNVRGGWTKAKIRKWLGHEYVHALTGVRTASKAIAEFDNIEQLKEHMFYHGTVFGPAGLKPSITMSEREAERYGGGGYGQRYWGISLSKDKKIASNFSGTSRSVRIYPVILLKDAKVIEGTQYSDAIDVEDDIEKLWNDGVDAVWIGDKNEGEQELLVLNPRSIVNIGTSDYYSVYQLGTEQNPIRISDDKAITKMYETAKELASTRAPKAPSKPSRYHVDEEGNYTDRKSDDEYRDEMERYEEEMREFLRTPEKQAYDDLIHRASFDVRFSRRPADEAYLEAVESGDMMTAAQMVRAAADLAGYNSPTSYQGSLAFNGAAPARNGYFETREERKEAFENDEFEGDYSLGDYVEAALDNNDLEWILANPIPASARDKATLASIRNLNNVVKGGKKTIKMYRAVDGTIEENSFRNGDWVTPSREYAEKHIELQDWKSGRIIEQEVPIDDIWWNGDDINEWGYDDGKEYAYQNTPNNRKLLETVTYDDEGNIIPLSQRFNLDKKDVRFSRVAPNGKPSNLSEKQWKSVRTPQFKTWFGDWEIATRAKSILKLKAEPLVEMPTGKTPKDVYDGLRNGENKIDGTKIIFFHSAYKKIVKEGGVSEKIIATLPNIFDNSILAYKEPDNLAGEVRPDGTEHRAHPNIQEVRNYVGKVSVDGNTYYVRFTVNIQKNNDGLHSYFATDINVYTTNSAGSLSYPNLLGARVTKSGIVDTKLQQFFESAREAENNSSKVVDENGEPLVVYHGTPAENIEEFNDEHKWTEAPDGTYWFSSNKRSALSYADENKNVVPVFINMRNPLVVDAEGANYDELPAGYEVYINKDGNELDETFETYKEAQDFAEKNGGSVSDIVPTGYTTTNEYARRAKEKGYDGVIFRNLTDIGMEREDGTELEDYLTDDYVVFSPNQIKHAEENNGDYNGQDARIRFSRGELSAEEAAEANTRFSKVTDKSEIERLEKEPKIKVYRSMQLIDGQLYPPMSAKVAGELREPTELGVWEKADENPDMADADGNFKLDKGNGKSLKAAYAPYVHTRRSPLNEQFSEAYNRPNLVVVEGYIPESELTSGYTAEKSKKSVGEHDWPSGKVSNALAKRGEDTRKVILSRWFKPIRVVPNSEVADIIMEKIGNQTIAFPYNVVTPDLRKELASRGAMFSGWQGNKPDGWNELVSEWKKENKALALGEENTRFSFIGTAGARRLYEANNESLILDDLLTAKQMEIAHKTPEEIKIATGWEKGADGKWRYEMPDVQVKKDIHELIKFPKSAHLADILEDNDAYKQLITAYPAIQGIVVHSSPMLSNGTIAGYNDYTDEIVFNSHRMWDYMADELRGYLVHELQHAIQHREGFAMGANVEMLPEGYGRLAKLKEESEQAYNEFVEAKSSDPVIKFMLATLKSEKLSDDDYEAGKEQIGESWVRLYNTPVSGRISEVVDRARAAAQQYEKELNRQEPYKELHDKAARLRKEYNDERFRIYQSFAGEVEARNVTRRLNMTEEGRKKSTAELTEDIKRKDQIVSFNAVSAADQFKMDQEANVFDSAEPGDTRFSRANENQAIFVSNAERAVEGIQMGKATPEQWLKMLEKNGGLKAGEDKWLGLSDWLKSSDKKTLTKQEVLDFIGENKIQIEEEHYAESAEESYGKAIKSFQDEFEELVAEGDEVTGSLYVADHRNYAWNKMVERYGDDFEMAFEQDFRTIIPTYDYDNDLTDAARYFLDQRRSGSTKGINPTRLDYTTKGLENKREIALTIPTIEQWNQDDKIHFGDAGEGRAIAWIRFGDAQADGKKVLFIDEIQSKRHQEGREKGYLDESIKNEEHRVGEEYNNAISAQSKLVNELDNKYGGSANWTRMEPVKDKSGFTTHYRLMPDPAIITKEEYNAYIGNRDEIERTQNRIDELQREYRNSGVVPSAPFEKNWHELSMKRMLRLAAEDGYDMVAWTTGDQQAERYNIGGVVSSIERRESNNVGEMEFTINLNDNAGSQYLTTDKEGNVITTIVDDFRDKNLSDIVGKEVAQKMLGLKENESISGDGLRVGGEGMKGFYDDILPRFVNKYGKKWGASTSDILVSLSDGALLEAHSVPVTPVMKESVMQGQVMFSRKDFGEFSIDKLVDRREKLLSTKPIPVAVGTIKASDGIRPMEAAYKWYDENIGSPRVYGTEVGDVTIDKESIQESLGHKFGQRKLDAVSSLFSGFENATYITSTPDMDGKPMVDHYFAYPIQYDGATCYVLCRAREDVNKNRLYIHEVFPLENIKSEALQTPADQSQPRRGLALYEKLLAAVIYDKDSNNSENDNTLYSRSRKVVEAVSKDGIGALVGKDNVSDLFSDIYRAMPVEMRREVVERAGKGDLNIHRALGDYIAEKAAAGFENDETGLLRSVASMIDSYAKDGGNYDEGTQRYLLWKLGQVGKNDLFAEIADAAMRYRFKPGQEQTRFSRGLKDEIQEREETADKLIDAAKENLDEQKKILKGKLLTAAKAMSAQKNYDERTIGAITGLAKDLLKDKNVQDLNRREVARLLGIVTTSVGKSSRIVKKYADALVDMIVDHLVRQEKALLDKVASVKAKKTTASGVEAQGALDIHGQNVLEAFKAGLNLQLGKEADEDDANTINGRLNNLSVRLDSSDDAVRAEAEAEREGLMLAKEYLENIKESQLEEDALKEEMKDAAEARRKGELSPQNYYEFVADAENALRENRIERIEAYRELRAKLNGTIAGSKDAAAEFREREKERIEQIHHLANSDMEGTPTSPFKKANFLGRLANTSLVRFFTSSLASLDQILRMFGRKNIDGKGYLWNKFYGGWQEASEREFLGRKEATAELDKKVSEVFGEEGMKWSDLYEKERKMPKVTVTWWDGGQMAEHELTQGNLLYIYMVNKMADGRMKLRRMGISDEVVQAIKEQMDERFLQLADWMQGEYMTQLRNKYNAVHERVFGASMAAIDDYFPLRINKRSLNKEEDVGRPDMDDTLPATTTGSIIKRRRNAQDLDLLNADAFSVMVEHVEEMEHWAAFAEFNKDLNTLLSYKRFRNQVQNTTSVYGTGKQLWAKFKNVARIAAGTYHPAVKVESLDSAAVNLSKAVTMAKINFRVYTAIKQLLSMPAFIADANIGYLLKGIATPKTSWDWAMENLPLVRKRWESKQAGDTRLMQTDSDWKLWRSKAVETAGRIGMTPNAFVDAVTVSIGAYAMYQTKYNQYVQDGYTEEQADKKAKQDATVLYNETQQSNEGAFLSDVQLDRTVLSTMITVFRNASMGYQRQLHDALRGIGRMMRGGYKEESISFMTKQMMRDGLTEEQAAHAAERRYNRALWHNLLRVATFGFGVQFAWNLGSYLVYLLFGDDDDKKNEYLEDAATHALLGGWAEGLAGGNVISEAINMLRKGESLSNYDPSLLPMVSDIKNMYRRMSYAPLEGANELVNLAVQMAVGVNPQTFTDSIVALMDAAGGNMDLSKEALLFAARALQVPQSQLDELMVDELGLSEKSSKDMDYWDVAERYARYKRRRNSAFTGWMYSDEAEEERETKYLKQFDKKVRKRENLLYNNEDEED